jgi:hypothetical protein
MPIAAWQYNSLPGQYRIAGQTVIDPPPSEAKDTHLHLTFSGAAARYLYNAMAKLKRAQKQHEEIV